ncbi:hypothetical protein QFZ57_003446 [Arthrobacter sp. B1I2]|nr:hypothetical protein [Arthrobacter sp. B1I2]
MGAHQQVGFGGFHEEGVLHFAGGVVRLEVQGVEVEPLGFHLGAFGDFPAHAHEDVGHAVLQRGERMAGTGAATARGGGDVNGFLDQDPGVVLGFQHRGPVGERLVDPAAGGAHQLSGERFLVLGQPANFTVGKAQRRLLTAVGKPHRLQLVQGGRTGDGGDGLIYSGVDGGLIRGVRDGGARQSFSHLLFLATSRGCRRAGQPCAVSRPARPSLAGHG